MEDRVPEATVRVVFPEIVPEVAVMVVVPTVTAVVRPPVLTVATAVFDEVQVTEMVISRVVPSENVPVAVNCWVAPTDRLGLDGVTAMDDRVAEVTVRVVFPEIVPEVAVMVVTPVVRAVARPLLLTVAIVVSEELQVTCVVISWVVPSAYVPVAVNCWVAPPGMFRLAGVTAMEDRVEEVTVRVVFPETVLCGGDSYSSCCKGDGQAIAANCCYRCIGGTPGGMGGYITARADSKCASGCKLLGGSHRYGCSSGAYSNGSWFCNSIFSSAGV